jgi:CubicO group peptidase (beta-lactamase class C family)
MFLSVACAMQGAFDELKVGAYLENYKNFSGAVLIINDTKIIFRNTYGYADYENKVRNTFSTKFPIASNTKSFTAFGIMKLQERKLLNVSDVLEKYIADFPYSNKITIHHLLTHTSGIQNYYKQWKDISDCKNLEQMVDCFKSWDLEFEPGTRYSYSNSNYTVLAFIIE